MEPVQCLGVLGLQPNYTMADLRQAYRRKALLTHPDKHAGREEQFHRVQEAYEKLLTRPAIEDLISPSSSSEAWQWTLLNDSLNALGRPDSFIWKYAHEYLGVHKASMLERLVREAGAAISPDARKTERTIELTCEVTQGLRREHYPIVIGDELHYVPLCKPATVLQGKNGPPMRAEVRWLCPDGVVVEYPNILYDTNVFDKSPFAMGFPGGRCDPMERKTNT